MLINALLLTAVIGSTPLEIAEQKCEKDYRACPERDRLRAEETAQRTEENRQRQAALDLERDERIAAQNREVEAEDAAEDALAKTCGKDYHRVKVGMPWKRVEKCSGPFSVKYADAHATVYEAAGGMVRVENGKVTRVLYDRR